MWKLIPRAVVISIAGSSMAAHVLGAKDEKHICWPKANFDLATCADLAITITHFLGHHLCADDTICELYYPAHFLHVASSGSVA